MLPARALFIPYNSVLYKKGRPHRPVMNTGGRPGANRPGFSRFAFCIRSSYTVGAPPAISRRNGPRVIKRARAGNAVDVRPATLCAPFDGRITDTGQDRPKHRSGDLHKTGTGTGHMAGASPGCVLPALYECRLLFLTVARGVLRRSAAARERTLPGSLGRGPFPAFPGCRRSSPQACNRARADCSKLDCKVLQELKDQKDRSAGLLCLLMAPARAEIAMAACAATPGAVYVPAPGSKHSAALPAISCALRVK